MCPQDACTIGQKIASITILLIFSAMAFTFTFTLESEEFEKFEKVAAGM